MAFNNFKHELSKRSETRVSDGTGSAIQDAYIIE
jgi:hypothetical protein